MAKFIAYADACPAGEAVSQERGGLSAEAREDLRAIFIQLLGAHAGLGVVYHLFEGVCNCFAGALHACQFGFFGY